MAEDEIYNLDYDEVMDVQDCEFGTEDFPPLTDADYNTIGRTILGEDQTKSALKEASPKAVTPAKIRIPESEITPEDKITFQTRSNRERDHILIKLNAKPSTIQNFGYYESNDTTSTQQSSHIKYGPDTQTQYYNNPKPKFKPNRYY